MRTAKEQQYVHPIIFALTKYSNKMYTKGCEAVAKSQNKKLMLAV